IPYRLPTGQPAATQEERRLFYVGLTRARYALFLTHAAKRLLRGRLTRQIPSPFLDDIERRLLEADRPAVRPRPGAARQLNMF
ncbi:MAG: hypothetical protein KKC37_14790, partial [Proteobacteria bacterium]|nr:hypothetical protein [Pseudomonadota bacterium]